MTKRSNRPQAGKQTQGRLVMWVSLVIIVGVLALMIAASQGGTAAPVEQARLDLDPILGNPEAPVTIIEYGAYGCSSCKAWHQAGVIDDLLVKYAGQVRFIFRDFPVIVPAYDEMAAALAQCVLDQGNDLFWKFHDALYSDAQQGFSTQEQLLELAEQIGAEPAALIVCAQNGTHRQTVQYDLDRARNLGLRGTPAFLINGERLFDASPEQLEAAVQQALAT